MVKKLLLIICALLISSIYSQSPQWTWQNPLPQGNNLNAVAFIDQNNGIIVGDYGTYLHSTNGGNNWGFLQLFMPTDLSSIFFINTYTGYGTLRNGTFIKTTNGGNSWINYNTGIVDTALNDVFFLNENYGFAVGDYGIILKTTNGGLSWNRKDIYYRNNKILMLDSNNIFICADAGWLLRTTNAGETWYNIPLGTTAELKDLKFLNYQTGFVVGGYYSQGLIYKTTNGGINWTNVLNITSNGLKGIFFRDSLNGFAVGYSGTLLKTSDGGVNWTNVSLNVFNDLHKGIFLDSNTGFIIGAGGMIFKTSDGGNTWNKITQGTGNYLYSSYFLNNSFGMAVGHKGTILKTTNGGINWIEKNINLVSNPSIIDIHIFDNNNALAVGEFGYIHKTTDSGETWNSFSGLNANDLLRLKFIADSIGFAVGYWGTVIKTTNRGQTWSFSNSGISNSISLFDCDFLDQSKGFICGSNGTILKTTDGGVNWSNLNSGTTKWLRGIDFWDENLGLIVGDNRLILRTTNGGVTWDSIYGSNLLEYFNSVKFITPQYAIVVGSEGKILISSDGGINWEEELSTTNNWLFRITVLDTANIFAVGQNGTILKRIKDIIPVELKSFTASLIGNSVKLHWSTATELNNSGFEIQRRQTQSNVPTEIKSDWQPITFIKGNGTTTEPNTYYYLDKNLSAGVYQYRLKQIDFDGSFEFSSIVEVEINIPDKFSLEQNYPNPFNPSTSIQYAVGNRQFVQLKVYDILGNEVATLVNEEKSPGTYEVEFNATQLSSGVYFYRLQAGDFIETKKMILLR